MPRIRSIKPEFWSDVKLTRLSRDVRMFYMALWNFADDEGRNRAIPKELAGFAFPYDDDIEAKDIREWLAALEQAGRIVLYSVDETPYYQVMHWQEHQSVNRPTPSRIPPPEGYVSAPLPHVAGLSEECVSDSGETHEGLSEECVSDSVTLRGVGSRNQAVGSSYLGSRKQEAESRETAAPLAPQVPLASAFENSASAQCRAADYSPLSEAEVKDLVDKGGWTRSEIAMGCVKIRGRSDVLKPKSLLHTHILPEIRKGKPPPPPPRVASARGAPPVSTSGTPESVEEVKRMAAEVRQKTGIGIGRKEANNGTG